MDSLAPKFGRWILGLDLGANSLGWAALRIGDDGDPGGLLHAPADMPRTPTLGVRIFEEGVENYGQGDREQSRAVQRRTARLQRRQTMRRARRITKVFNILQGAGLLPEFPPSARERDASSEEARDSLLKALDRSLVVELRGRFAEPETDGLIELLPYALRAEAARAPLPLHAAGRALFHLAQRRGFQSNRKTDGKSDERSQVLKEISELQGKIDVLGAGSTLGQYLYECGLRGERIRRRWTKRSMYKHEFEAIWIAQSRQTPELMNDALKKRLGEALFHQRPLRSQQGLVGICEFENGSEYRDQHSAVQGTKRRKRAPECLLVSQRFRMWQTINNIRLKSGDGSARSLEADERERLAARLDGVSSLSISDAKRLIGVGTKTKMNLQDGGAKELRGNRTNASLLELFGERWKRLTGEDQDAIVWDIWNARDNEALVARARNRRGAWARLEPTRSEAESLDDLVISGDYMSLSPRAMERILPALRTGLPYANAARAAYGILVGKDASDLLPPVRTTFRDLRNPVVSRALTELRRVVNDLVRQYGKPDSVRIELARDMKRGKDDRRKLQKQIGKNEDDRARVRERLLQEWGMSNPRAGDILRLRLHEECGGQCPYTGSQIGMSDLFGGAVDIEHIIPFSRCLDDSFTNMTLCFAETNRNEKQNKTPFEAFCADAERWEKMCQRMRKHVADGRMSEGKLRRFQMTTEEQAEFLEGFKSSQLNDTRHASLRAREYLMTLYGGDLGRGVDNDGKTRVQVGNGTVTALLRRAHGIDRLLTTAPGKKREDHRHHAVDAVAIALTSPRFQQRLSTNAERAWKERMRWVGSLSDPWPTFMADVKGSVEQIVPSFRIDNRVRGALHAETIYSPRRTDEGAVSADGSVTHIRKPLADMSAKEVVAIVDPRVRSTVESFLNGREPKKVFVKAKPETHPFLEARDGRRIPIMRARIRKQNSTYAVGSGGRVRNVENADNHHLIVRDVVDAKGRKKVQFDLVPMFTAYQRKKEAPHEPVVRLDDSVRLWVRRNDVLAVAVDGAPERFCRVLALSGKEFEGCWATDARTFEQRKTARVRITPSKLSEGYACRKVFVTPIGVVRPCRV